MKLMTIKSKYSSVNTWKLNNMLLNEIWAKKKSKKKLKNFMKGMKE